MPRKLGKGGQDVSWTHLRNLSSEPCRWNAYPGEPHQHLEASLMWEWSRSTARSVDSEPQRHVMELRKFQCGRRRPGQWRGPCCSPVRVRGVQADRSRSASARRREGFHRNLGDPVVSMGLIGKGYAEPKDPRSLGGVSGTERNELPDAPRGTAARRQRRAAGRTAGSRSAVIVLEKRGTGPREGKRGVESWPRGGDTRQGHRTLVSCQRNRHG